MKRYSFSKAGILAMPVPEKNKKLYLDPELQHHYVRVTPNGARSFVVNKNDVKRGRVEITLGGAGTDSFTAVQSREQARIALGLLAEGYGVAQIRDRLARAEERIPEGATTFQQVFDEYLLDRKHKLAPRTVRDYRKLLETHLADWRHRPIEAIDEEAVKAKFRSIASASRANYAFRLVRALFNTVVGSANADGRVAVASNPAEILSKRGMWHRDTPKREVIRLAELPAWWRAVNGLVKRPTTDRTKEGQFAKGMNALNADLETARDFLQFLLLTGLRRNEAAALKWETVDLASKMFTVPVTKNREPHTLPLSDFLLSMLKRRYKERSTDPARAPYVFPGAAGPLAEPKKQIKKVVAASSVAFSSHTLRRTFASIAESLDIPYLALKRLLNHRAQDVTGRSYTVIDVERLRTPMQKISDFVLKAAKRKKSADVVKLQQRKAA